MSAFQPRAKSKRAASDEDDIPADWSEDDILAEFEDLDDGGDVDGQTGTVTSDNSQQGNDGDDDDLVVFEDDAVEDEDDDDDDDDDLDDIDLDEDDEDEEEFLIEEEQIRGGVAVSAAAAAAAVSNFKDPNEVEPVFWDEEEDGGEYELENDEDDPNYMKQKELVEEAIASSEQRARDEAFDPLKFVMSEMTQDQATMIEQLPFLKEVEERARSMTFLEESDVQHLDLPTAVEEAPDFEREDPYPRHERGEPNILEGATGLTDDDMEAFDQTYKDVRDKIDEEPWDKVLLKDMTGWGSLSNDTLAEMEACLDYLGGSSYNVTRWLLYDLDFNVSNLLLAAIKHNPEAPILLHHWYPQLVTYSRYSHVQERNCDFTWDDVDNADIGELQRYYAGFGYDTIPNKAPSETGIIRLEELDEEEIKMAAFENWMSEVYNPEWDRKDFDDDDMQDEDNVFSDFFEPPQHPDKPPMDDVEDDLEQWHQEIAESPMADDPELQAYRDRLGEKFVYDIVRDEEFDREFRGHLVIACSSDDADLAVAEKITARFEREFGKKVWVETRVEALAREEDNVFEIWLESYEIDLLHSKRRANSSNKDWQGPAECDDAQINYLVERVRFLISDDARYSYRMEFETVN